MRFLLPIILLISLSANSQFGNRNFFGHRPPIEEGFNWNSLQVQSPTTYTSQSNLIIDGKKFTNLNCSSQSGNNLVLNSCTNVTIRNCYFGSSCGLGIAISSSTNVTIENCFFANNKSGIYVDGSSQDIVIQDNQSINPCGPFPRGQFVQFNGVTTSASGQCAIRRNRIKSYRGESYPEDIVNMFASSGRSGAPIDISDNILEGGGPSPSGGGILAGDSEGSYATVDNNWIISPGNYGIAIAGGSNYILNANRVYSVSYSWNNIGAYIWAQGGATCSNVTFTNNLITYLDETGAVNNFWNAGNCGTVTISGNIYNQSYAFMFPDLPSPLIDMVTEDILWQIRDESQQFRTVDWLARPTANAGVDQNITISTATLSGAASTSTNGKNYRWVQTEGPNTATMSAPLAVTNNLSGLITGTYIFRLEVTDNDGASDSDLVTISVTLT